MKEAGMPPEFSRETVNAWKKEFATLKAEREAEYAKFKLLREDPQTMPHIQYCVNRVIKQRPECFQQEKQKTNAEEW